jgi:hypothetical protein
MIKTSRDLLLCGHTSDLTVARTGVGISPFDGQLTMVDYWLVDGAQLLCSREVVFIGSCG